MRKYLTELKGNATTRTPNFCLFVDTEAFIKDPNSLNDQRFRLGTAIYVDRRSKSSEKRYVFHSLEEFYDIVEQHSQYKSGKLCIFAHNQRYDFIQLGCKDWLTRLGYSVVGTPMIYPRFIKAKFKKEGRQTIEFYDSMNIYNQSIEKLGKALGKFKKEIPKDRWNETPDEVMEDYCMRDTEILRDAMMLYFEFLEEHDCGNFKPTISGQSMECFTHRFQSYDLNVTVQPSVLKMERASYHGARVEINKETTHDQKWLDFSCTGDMFYELDYNSMYAYVMAKERYPIKYVGYYDGSQDSDERFAADTERGFLSIAEVDVIQDQPVLPLRDPETDRLTYPTNVLFRTTLAQPELQYAAERGWIKEWYRRNVYQGAYIFGSYVTYFYDLKEKYTDMRDNAATEQERAYGEVFRLITKMFLVSLYGKFGQRSRRWIDLGETKDTGMIEEYDATTGESNTIVNLFDHSYIIEKTQGETNKSIPAISSFITSYGRILIWNTISQVTYYYCDTDGFITNTEGYIHFKHKISNALGHLSFSFSPTLYLSSLKHHSQTPISSQYSHFFYRIALFS